MKTVKQAAKEATVSSNLVYLWCASGALRHLRLGGPGRRGKILIAEDDWAAFLNARKVGGQELPAVSPAVEQLPAIRASRRLKHLKMKGDETKC